MYLDFDIIKYNLHIDISHNLIIWRGRVGQNRVVQSVDLLDSAIYWIAKKLHSTRNQT